MTYCVLFFFIWKAAGSMWRGSPDIRIKSGLNRSPVSATEETWGYLDGCRYVLHDRDTKFCPSFRSVLAAGGVKTMALPARSPNLNAFAERWVRSAKEECLSKLILFGEGPLSRTLAEFTAHYHGERNHQGKGNQLLFPHATDKTEQCGHGVECRQRLGGLLKFYARAV